MESASLSVRIFASSVEMDLTVFEAKRLVMRIIDCMGFCRASMAGFVLSVKQHNAPETSIIPRKCMCSLCAHAGFLHSAVEVAGDYP